MLDRTYIWITLAHSLHQVTVGCPSVNVFYFGLGIFYWGLNKIHTHVHKASEIPKEAITNDSHEWSDIQLPLLLSQ